MPPVKRAKTALSTSKDRKNVRLLEAATPELDSSIAPVRQDSRDSAIHMDSETSECHKDPSATQLDDIPFSSGPPPTPDPNPGQYLDNVPNHYRDPRVKAPGQWTPQAGHTRWSRTNPFLPAIDGYSRGGMSLGRDYDRTRALRADRERLREALHTRHPGRDTYMLEAEAPWPQERRTFGHRASDPRTTAMQMQMTGQEEVGSMFLEDRGMNQTGLVSSGHVVTIEKPHLVTLPRTMPQDTDDQLYDNFTQGVATHSNSLRYHVRVLEAEDVGREEFMRNSGNVWYRA